MGGKSIAARAANRRQRQKMNMSRYSASKFMVRPENMMEERDDFTINITTDTVSCKNCGFKAKYKFIRCPQCGDEQKSDTSS